MPSEVRIQDLLRRLKTFGVTWELTRRNHYKLTRRSWIYILPTKKGRFVLPQYIPKLRRKLRLSPEAGVTDAEFWGN